MAPTPEHVWRTASKPTPTGKAAELQLLLNTRGASSTVTLTAEFAQQLVDQLTYWQRHQAEVADHAERASTTHAEDAARWRDLADRWQRIALACQEQRDIAMYRLHECQAPTFRGALRAWWREHVVGEL